MNKKNLIQYGILFIAGLILTNAGVFFLLKATQPKTSHAEAVNPDSVTAAHDVAAAHADATHESGKHTPANDTTTAAHVTPVSADNSHEEHLQETAEKADMSSASAHSEAPESVASHEDNPTDDLTEQAVSTAINDSGAATGGQVPPVEEAAVDDAKQLAKLAKVMESMKPSEAAMIAAELPTETVIALLMKMKDRTAAKVLAAMPVELASQVASEMSALAQR